MDVYRGIIANHSIRSVATRPGEVYVGGSIFNGYGTQPTATEARLAGFDLATRAKIWEITPVPGAKQIVDLVTIGYRLYGVTDTGTLFVVDTRTHEVTTTGTVAAGQTTMVVVDGVVYGTSGKDVWKLDRASMTVTPFVPDLNAKWYGASALLTAAPDGSALYALRDRNLVRIEL